MNDLNDEDIATLIEALDAWLGRHASGEMLGDLLCAAFSKDDDAAKSKLEADRLERRQKAEVERRLEQDTATLLKAKLIGIRRTRLLARASAA